MKIAPFLILLLPLASCVSTQAPDVNESSAGTGQKVQTVTVPMVRVKNYNQYNMTLEKLTGLGRANYNVLFESLKGSLPADNEIEGLTGFNLIAMTRLADAYCTDFINRETTLGLNGDLNPMIVADVRDFLFSRFLDAEPGDRSFDSLRIEVDNVLSNQGGLFPGVVPGLNGSKTLAVAACVTILASPYITLLE
jgi:hypothetical protein